MSSISGNYSYSLDYSSLFGASSSTSASSSLYGLTSSSSLSSYGTNTSSLSTSQSTSAIKYKNAADALLKAANSITQKKNDGTSVFSSFSAVSSNSDVISATYADDVGKYSSEALAAKRDPSYKAADPVAFGIKVEQLATAQVNKSEALDAKGMVLEANQTYRFEISDGTKTTSFAFVAEEGDTNESIQKKMAAAINDKDIGVKASVSTNGNGKTSLTLESRTTGVKDGEENAFEIRDVSGYDAVSKLGADNISQKAQNAVFYVGEIDTARSTSDEVFFKEDPQRLTSTSNTVNVNGRTDVTLKKTTDDFVTVDYTKDSKSSINAVRDLVNGFNSLMDVATSGTSTVYSNRLATQLSGAAKTYEKALASIGITKNADGYLEIDEKTMEKAAADGSLEKFFQSESGSTNYGFAHNLGNIAKSVSNDPIKYVDKTEVEATNKASWDTSSTDSSNNNYSKLYFDLMRYEMKGMLFNSNF